MASVLRSVSGREEVMTTDRGRQAEQIALDSMGLSALRAALAKYREAHDG